MSEKKQQNMHVFFFCMIILLPWMSYIFFMLISEMSEFIAGDLNSLLYLFPEQLIALIPAVIMVVITLLLNCFFKPDLREYVKMHMFFGITTNLICIVLFVGFFVLSNGSGSSFNVKLMLLHINLYWLVPVISLLMEIVLFMKHRVYRKPKELTVLLVSNAGMAILFTLVAELFIIASHI